MKKSISVKMDEAKALSKQHPKIAFRVMDKAGEKAVVCASDWVYRERILAGWHVVVSYMNGGMV